jgi:hypothetical protein
MLIWVDERIGDYALIEKGLKIFCLRCQLHGHPTRRYCIGPIRVQLLHVIDHQNLLWYLHRLQLQFLSVPARAVSGLSDIL